MENLPRASLRCRSVDHLVEGSQRRGREPFPTRLCRHLQAPIQSLISLLSSNDSVIAGRCVCSLPFPSNSKFQWTHGRNDKTYQPSRRDCQKGTSIASSFHWTRFSDPQTQAPHQAIYWVCISLIHGIQTIKTKAGILARNYIYQPVSLPAPGIVFLTPPILAYPPQYYTEPSSYWRSA